MPPSLFVIQDDLFFAERVRASARRLGLEALPISPEQAETRQWEPGSVVVLQITLNPERQLDLVGRLNRATPRPRVVAVSGHLETALRSKAKALGAILAPHSGMDRVLARALSAGDGGADTV